MLGKLMKYEFKATSRIYVPLFSAMLIVSAISRLMMRLQSDAPHIVGVTTASMLMVAAVVVTLILTIQRFYRNFMTSEGYLMFTLPVSTGKLIWSKLLVAAVWNIVCVIAVFLSIVIMANSGKEIADMLQSLFSMDLSSVNEAFFMIEFAAILLGLLLGGILSLYTCLALSLFFNKHRIPISFAIFIVMNTLLQILFVILVNIAPHINITLGEGLRAFADHYPEGALHIAMLVGLLGVCAVDAVFFAVTRHMLKNRLNMQ